MGAIRGLFKQLPKVIQNRILVVILLIIVVVVLVVIWLSQEPLRQSAIASAPNVAAFHAYMIGLVIPETFLTSLGIRSSNGTFSRSQTR